MFGKRRPDRQTVVRIAADRVAIREGKKILHFADDGNPVFAKTIVHGDHDIGRKLFRDMASLRSVDGVKSANRYHQDIAGPDLPDLLFGQKMPQIAAMDQCFAESADDVDQIFSPLAPVAVVVPGADNTDLKG